MKRLWFNQNGILRDAVGLIFCDYCPCDAPTSSSVGSSSVDPCQDGCRVILPTEPTGVIDYFDLISTSYDPVTGDWEVVMEVKLNGAYSTGVLLNSGGSNAVITNHTPAPNFPGGPAYTAGTIITVSGTSDPPTSANCGTWTFSMQSFSVAYLPFTFSSEICAVEVPCCPGVFIPKTLTAVITGGSCAGTYTLEYGAGGGDGWRAIDGPPDINLSCTGAGWYLEIDFDAIEPTTISCNPLELFGDFTGFGGLCGDFTITITG